MTSRPRYSVREQRRKPPEVRFWEKVDRSGECWIWVGADRNSYGGFAYDGKRWRVHRLVYTWRFGDIPEGLDIDHKCHERKCVRPEHLQAVSRGLNLQNQSGAYANSKSGVRGVCWNKRSGKWIVTVTVDHKSHWGGTFADLASAEAAAISLRNRLMTNNLLDRAS